MNKIIKRFIRLILPVAGLLAAMLGSGGPAWAAVCAFDANNQEFFGAKYTLRVDAGTTCAEMSMDGCEPVVDGSGSCQTTSGMDVTFSINAADGSLSWVSQNPSNHPDVILIKGGTQGNGCGYFNPDEFAAGNGLGDLNNKGEYTGIKSAQACTDNTQNPISQAVLQLSKTVTTPETDCMSAGDFLSVDITDPAVGVQVKYCYALTNIGGSDAVVDTVLDDNGTGFYDPACTDCPDDDFSPFVTPLTLSAGQTILASRVVTISQAGTITNVAAASGTWTDPTDPGTIVALYAENSATVVARQGIEPCPPDPQGVMDGTWVTEDGFDFGFFLDSNNPNRSALCVPTSVKTRGVQCNNECVPRDCVNLNCDLPNNTTCEPSGVWNKDYDPTTAGTFPYCWEVAMDRDRDGLYKRLSPVKQDNLTVVRRNDNPNEGTYCYSSGGREICFDYCYPKADEPADICDQPQEE